MESARQVIDPEGDVLLVVNRDPSGGYPSLFKKEGSSVTTAISTLDEEDIVDCTSGGNGPRGIEIQVSSRHLTLPSRFFERSSPQRTKQQGLTEWCLCLWR